MSEIKEWEIDKMMSVMKNELKIREPDALQC